MLSPASRDPVSRSLSVGPVLIFDYDYEHEHEHEHDGVYPHTPITDYYLLLTAYCLLLTAYCLLLLPR